VLQVFFVLFVFLGGIGVWTWPVYARQALYHLNHYPTPFYSPMHPFDMAVLSFTNSIGWNSTHYSRLCLRIIIIFFWWYWGLNPWLHSCQAALYCLSHASSPRIILKEGFLTYFFSTLTVLVVGVLFYYFLLLIFIHYIFQRTLYSKPYLDSSCVFLLLNWGSVVFEIILISPCCILHNEFHILHALNSYLNSWISFVFK
jgi:hypothetical protein